MGPNDAPAALVMGAGMLGFGLTMILRPVVSEHRLTDSQIVGSRIAGTPIRCLFGHCAWRV